MTNKRSDLAHVHDSLLTTIIMRKFIACIVMMLAIGAGSINAQSVERKGNNFVQVSTTTKDGKTASKEVKTKYTYTTKDGKTYPIWLSATGKAFIKRISAKTGKEYKQYLPEVGKQINPSAYK